MSRDCPGTCPGPQSGRPKPPRSLPRTFRPLFAARALRAGLLEHPVGLDVAIVLGLEGRLLGARPLAVAVGLDVALVLSLERGLLGARPLAVAVCLDVLVRRRRLLVLFHCSSF